MAESKNVVEELTVDFDVQCDKFTKNWATQLALSLKESFEKIASSINTMNTNICKRFDDLELQLRNDISQTATKAEAAVTVANANKIALQQLRSEVDELRQWCRDLKNENVTLKSQTNNIETYSRRDNLVFYGIKEPSNETNESCEQSVRRFLQETLLITDEKSAHMPFVRCHRMQELNKNRIRPIIVRFVNFKDRELVWSKKSAIINRDYHIGEDYPKEIAYHRRKLFPVFSKARRLLGIDRKKVSLKLDTLTIMGRRYTVNTLDQLTGDLNMKTFSERSNGNLLVFGGMYSNFHPLSNYYLCPITVRNHRYANVEQAYQFIKAEFFGDLITAQKIKASSDPTDAKRLSYDIKGSKEMYDRWNAQRYELMTEIVMAKFSQNPKLAVELKASGTKQLAESGKHDYYAVGLSITHRDILNNAKWTGSSKLGDILMHVRRELNRAA